MELKLILARLQSALGRNDLIQQMVLSPGSAKASKKAKANKAIKLVVGYDGSPNSQTALDMTLWIAHQSRLATQKQVVVHVVYVIDYSNVPATPAFLPHLQMFDAALGIVSDRPSSDYGEDCAETGRSAQATAVLTHPCHQETELMPLFSSVRCVIPGFQPTDAIEHADYVLWQARCLAEEWRGSLEAHLRFGNLAQELRSVVESETADLLLLGCTDASHPLVKQLTTRFPCAILGIPHQIHPEEAAVCTY